jgi:RNA-directed DNA polymerase
MGGVNGFNEVVGCGQRLDNGSRVSGDAQARFCEGPRGQFPRSTHLVIFVGSQRSGERILASLTAWIATHLHLRVNTSKSGVGRPWHGQFLGLRITEERQIAPAPRSVERLKGKVREIWNARWSIALEERIHSWQRYIRGWWNYFRVCDQRREIDRREGWMRRHMRKYFWQRWHNRKGRLNALRRLKAQPYHLHQASGSVGAWRKARSPMLQTVLNNARLKRWGLYVPSDLVAP